MTVHFYVLFIGVLMLVGSGLVLRRSARLHVDAQVYWCEEPVLSGEDALLLELGTRIFAPEDYALVKLETSREFHRRFRAERTALALGWLDQVRRGAGRLMRAHVRAARRNPNLRPADEVKLGFEFLVFRLTIGLLYCAVWLRGPLHAAKLVGYCSELARELKRMSVEALPVASSMAVEIMKGDSEAKRRTVVL